MPATTKKYNNVGLPPVLDRDFKKVCNFYGWTKVEGIRRMVAKELTDIQHGNATPQPRTADNGKQD